MIKPKGSEYDDNEYHGPPITNPNPGKKGAVPGNTGLTLADMAVQGSVSDSFVRAVLNADTSGGYNNLLSVIPPDGVARSIANPEMETAWRQSRLHDYNRMAAERGMPQVQSVIQEQAYHLDEARVRELERQGFIRVEGEEWDQYNQRRAAARQDDNIEAAQGALQALQARRINRVVNEALINGRQPSYTNEEIRRVLGRRRSEELLPHLQRSGMLHPNISIYTDNEIAPTYMGRPMADYNEAEWAEIMDRWRQGARSVIARLDGVAGG